MTNHHETTRCAIFNRLPTTPQQSALRVSRSLKPVLHQLRQPRTCQCDDKFLGLWVLGMGCVILLRHSLSLPYIPSKKSSAQVGVRVNSVLTRNGCIKCFISLFKEIILQHLDAFPTEIQGSLKKLCTFKASRGHPSKVVKLPIMSPGAENVEYLNNP